MRTVVVARWHIVVSSWLVAASRGLSPCSILRKSGHREGFVAHHSDHEWEVLSRDGGPGNVLVFTNTRQICLRANACSKAGPAKENP